VHSSFSERSKNISSPKIEDYVFNFLKTIDSLVQKNINGYLDISCLTIPSTSYFCSIRNKTIVSPYKIMAPCVEIIKPGTKDDLILNYDLDNIDFNNIRKIQEEKLFNLHPKNYNICSNCNFVHFCKSNCPMRTILSNSKPNIYNCMLSKKLLPEFLERANKNDKYMAIVFGNDYKKEEVCD
jgi:radical SAM protein with 4Fe4S-binding SPASM domain